MRILLAHDASPSGDDAVALARLLAGGDEAELTAAIVVPYPPGELGDPPLELPERAETWGALCEGLERAGAATLAERVREPLAESGMSVSDRVLLRNSPAAALTELCERERPDLMVIGSTHRGNLGRVMLGGTGERLAHGASAPLAIAPREYADRSPRRPRLIGVGFDGGPESRRALRLAGELARRHGAALRIVAVIERQIGEFEIAEEAFNALSEQGVHDRRVERLRARTERALEEEDLLELEVNVEVSRGSPTRELQDESESGLDLLVLGSRGYGPLARVLLGSVSSALSNSAGCPVVIATRSAGDP